MRSQPPPKSIAGLLWNILRLSARMVWGSPTNQARVLLDRQKALNVLGLPVNVSKEQIKQRYRTLAKEHHPDRGGDREQMQRIIAAYQLLIKE